MFRLKKIVPTPGIASWAQGDRTRSASCHRVVVFLVSLNISNKLEATVFIVVELKSRHRLRGLSVAETPSAGGNKLSQNTVAYTISMISRPGSLLNGRVL